MKTKFALILALLLFCAGLSSASPLVYVPTSSGVSYSVNSGGFFVSNAPIAGTVASAGANISSLWGNTFQLSANGPSYSDAGIVLFFDGSLTLGQLQSVTVATTNPGAMNINLWLDTDGNGQFFAFIGPLFHDLNGDSYGSFGNTTSLGGASPRSQFFYGPAGANSPYVTLAELQTTYPNAAVAIWAGITNAGGSAYISSITVNTVPEPGSTFLIAGGLIGIGLAFRRKKVS
jgi:hypothetical protein